jgi:hypothetical protein
MEGINVQDIVRQAIKEFVETENRPREVAYRDELREEVRRRELLERRVNELVAANQRREELAERAELDAAVRALLCREGIRDLDLWAPAITSQVVATKLGISLRLTLLSH